MCARSRTRKTQFLNTARASLAEVSYCLHVARRLDYIDAGKFEEFEIRVKRTSAALNGYIRSIRMAATPSRVS